VKARSDAGYGDPWEAVGPEKARRIEQAAEVWLARRRELAVLDVHFEVVAVRGRQIERVGLH
jgi:Holliday junction resolvase-like predicted endonuclease